MSNTILYDIIDEPNTEIYSETFIKISNKIDSDWNLIFPKIGEKDMSEDSLIKKIADMIHYCDNESPLLGKDDIYDIPVDEVKLNNFYLNTIKSKIYDTVKQLKNGERLAKKIRIQVAQDIIEKCKYEEGDE